MRGERELQAFSYETEGLVVFVNKKLDQWLVPHFSPF